jgi:L-seryl-tRNA(Ser) seleniumtransferase
MDVPPVIRLNPVLRPPSVERLLVSVRPMLEPGLDPTVVRRAAREVQADERRRLADGAEPRTVETLGAALIARVRPIDAGPTVVINATGVIIHTNLGRAGWPTAAIEAAGRAARGQVLLEMDRRSGRRGARYRAAEELLIALTGAQDALVTNNNAAALALAVGLAGRRGVLVSRGELVEIGGGVRIPEVIRRAGARLIEVGTTNRTRVADYEAPLDEGRAALVLRVHRSNFRQEGFVESPEAVALASLAHRYGVPVVDDLGSGALLDTSAFGLAHEPTPAERLAAGADLVTFSGDKLLGGPQAGLIAGRADLMARLRRDPLARAMRPDKVTLAALAATLDIYRAGRALLEIPVWRAIAVTVPELEGRVRSLLADLGAIGSDGRRLDTVATLATVGGGSLPGETLPSVALRISGPRPEHLAARLRAGEPCVVGRVEAGAVLLDLRSVALEHDQQLAAAIVAALGPGGGA